jgi:hypothetical protein
MKGILGVHRGSTHARGRHVRGFLALLVGVLATGAMFTALAPATGVLTGPNSILYGVSCPSSSLCVAVDSHGHAVISTNPTTATPTWNTTTIEGVADLTAVSCASTALCLAVDANGRAAISTDPTAAKPSWSSGTKIDEGLIHSISCPSTSLCVAVDTEGRAVISTDPTAAVPTWTATIIDTTSPPLVYPANPKLYGVSCPSTSLCVAVDSRGDVVISTNPTTATPTWSAPEAIDSTSLSGISCPSTSLCVAVGRRAGLEGPGDGIALISTDPAAATPTWSLSTSFEAEGIPELPLVSCASTSLCAIINGFDALISTDPTTAIPTWSDPGPINTLPAGTPSLRGSPAVSGMTLTFHFACSGEFNQKCNGAAVLHTTERLTPNGHGVTGVTATTTIKRHRSVVIGRATFATAGGQTVAVNIKLNSAGVRLLAKFKRLPAVLSVMASTSELRVPPRMMLIKTAEVKFNAKAKPRRRS